MDGRITFEGCQGCGACLLTCPTHAIRPGAQGLYTLDQLCTLCLECLEICPADAIRLTPQDPGICLANHASGGAGAVVCQANSRILEVVE